MKSNQYKELLQYCKYKLDGLQFAKDFPSHLKIDEEIFSWTAIRDKLLEFEREEYES